MMLGELTSWNPTAQIPPWDPLDDPTVGIPSPFSVDNRSPTFNRKTNCQTNSLLTAALCRYLPSNEFVSATESGSLNDESSDNVVVDAFSCDHFRMFEFKIRKCARARSHDWTECPYAHPGEKARRRDPRKCSYSGSSCLEFRKGECRKGESCEFAHGVFESWLHPTRYRTQPCKDGMGCRRRVCFFAHCPEQLRVPTQLSPKSNGPGEFFDESPRRHSFDPYYSISPSESPPTSPNSPQVVSNLVSSMRNLQLGKMKTMSSQWEGFGSPRGSVLRPGLYSNPSTPTQSGFHSFNIWDQKYEEEPSMERVESGRNLRAQKYARLRKQNPLDREESASSAPDFGWVSELIDDL